MGRMLDSIIIIDFLPAAEPLALKPMKLEPAYKPEIAEKTKMVIPYNN